MSVVLVFAEQNDAMRPRMFRYPGLLLMLLLPLHAIAGQQSPEAAVKAFYRWEIHGYSALRVDTLPRVRHLFTPELYELLIKNEHYEHACRALVPDGMKPWHIDGDLWYYHLHDGARSLEHARLRRSDGKRAEVDARLVYDESLKWTDTLVLRRIGGIWRIADIRFGQGGGVIERIRKSVGAQCGRDRSP
jgi:hypothetical protein